MGLRLALEVFHDVEEFVVHIRLFVELHLDLVKIAEVHPIGAIRLALLPLDTKAIFGAIRTFKIGCWPWKQQHQDQRQPDARQRHHHRRRASAAWPSHHHAAWILALLPAAAAAAEVVP